MAGIEAVRALQSVFQAERGVDLVVAAILLAAIGELRISGFGQHGFDPVNALGKFLNFRRRHAGGVHGGNDAAHAGAGNAVHRDVILFQPLEHADFGQAERAAAAERETDARAVCGLRPSGFQ